MSSHRNCAIAVAQGPALHAVDLLKEGEQVASRYTVVRFLGKGSFGTVYECTDSMLADVAVAVKLFSRAVLKNHKRSKRIHQEMLACQRVNHPNVAAFYDCIQTESVVGYSMELVDGSSFEELIADRSNLSAREMVRVMKQLLRGMSAIHKTGIVHRDVKPSNILLTRLGEVKISDFGIANHQLPEAQEGSCIEGVAKLSTDARVMKCSMAGRIVGTPLYLAPEYIAEGVFDLRSDLYAVGAVMYELLTGRVPHCYATLPELFLKKVEMDPEPPITINPACTQPLSEITMKLLSRDPAQRFQNADEVEREILKMEQSQEKRARKTTDRHLVGNLFEVHRNIDASGKVIAHDDTEGVPAPRPQRGTSTALTSKYEDPTLPRNSGPTLLPYLNIGIAFAVLAALLGLSWERLAKPVEAPVSAIAAHAPVVHDYDQSVPRFHGPAESKATIIRSMQDARRMREGDDSHLP
ncbi:MAG: serine/threonine protein kinase [Deltaproteobacteria bacterium]|nr:serine/threonine protein kinase [Deltaproteobacteria bacterium]